MPTRPDPICTTPMHPPPSPCTTSPPFIPPSPPPAHSPAHQPLHSPLHQPIHPPRRTTTARPAPHSTGSSVLSLTRPVLPCHLLLPMRAPVQGHWHAILQPGDDSYHHTRHGPSSWRLQHVPHVLPYKTGPSSSRCSCPSSSCPTPNPLPLPACCCPSYPSPTHRPSLLPHQLPQSHPPAHPCRGQRMHPKLRQASRPHNINPLA